MSINSSRRKFTSLALGLPVPAVLFPRLHNPGGVQLPSGELLGVYFNVRDFGAAGDGNRLETQAIQSAVEACARAGGGVVYLPAGTYLSGTIYFRSGVTLHLAEGSTLLGSPNLSDYPVTIPEFRSYSDNYTERSLLYGEKVERIGITGKGVIDGQSSAFQGDYKVRPFIMRLVQCRQVSVSELTFQNSPMWVQHYLACEDVQIRGIRVRSRCCTVNHDGLDIDSCQRVRVADCDISSEDDAIVLKSTSALPCRDIVITNCIISSRINALKFGTDSAGGFENIAISNITVYETGAAGIALEIVDGGLMDRVTITNIVMRETACPVFIRLGDRGRTWQSGMPRPGIGKLRNVVISNIQATGADDIGCCITGLPGHEVENVSLENLSISFRGGGTREAARRQIPEEAESYPEYNMFGVLPAYGFYCRHISGLSLVNLTLAYEKPDLRPSLVCDDVVNLNLSRISAASQPDGEPLIRLDQVRKAWLESCRATTSAHTFLQVNGGQSAGIRLMANDFSNVSKAVELNSDVPAGEVQSCSCRNLIPSRRVH
ncbi:MAG: glycoside hydrolase family 28 protein [Acidobacteria bacterium]|nr:glycoside hydrolase family 28 protein [Acidobacteriota bacterium]